MLDGKGRVHVGQVLSALVLFLWALPAQAAPPGDTLLTIPTESQGSGPQYLTVSGDYLYFSADDGIHGRELWKLDRDGHASLAIDIVPGSKLKNVGTPTDLVNAAGRLYFFSQQRFLWATKGEPFTSLALRDCGLNPPQTIALGNKFLYAFRNDLWAVGSVPEILCTGKVDGGLYQFDGRVYFNVREPEGSYQTWVSDGTPLGTRPIRDEQGKSLGYFTTRGIEMGDSYFFPTSQRGAAFWELRRGQSEARRLFSYPGEETAPRRHFTRVGSGIVFVKETPAHGAELWRITPTFDGEALLLDIDPGEASSGPFDITPLGEIAVFIASQPDTGAELWRTDGTTEGTWLLKDLVPGPVSSDPYQLEQYKDWVLFSCENYAFGEELWRTDGTAEGTVLVKDINPEGDAEPYSLTTFNGKVYFAATHHAYGEELWESDGTAAGTKLAARIKPALRSVGSAEPEQLTAFEGRLYFTARTAQGTRALWLAEGSKCWPAQTVHDRRQEDTSITEIRVVDRHLFFTSENTRGIPTYWRFSPADDSAQIVDTIPMLAERQPLRELLNSEQYAALVPNMLRDDQWARAAGNIFFVAYTPAFGAELWMVDENEAAPRLLRDIMPGPASSSPRNLISTGTHIIFYAEDINRGGELWISDGTPDGTAKLLERGGSIGVSHVSHEYAITNEGLLFHTKQLVQGGYALAESIPPFDQHGIGHRILWHDPVAEPTALTAVGDTLYFVLEHPAYGKEIWHVRSSPLTEGTVQSRLPELLKDIRPNTAYDERTKTWTPLSFDQRTE